MEDNLFASGPPPFEPYPKDNTNGMVYKDAYV